MRTSSGIEPRAVAITGVPQAIASTTLNPNGSSKLTRCRSASGPAEELAPARGLDRPDVVDVLAVDQRRDVPVEVLLILDDPGDDERHPGPRATSIASTVPLSGWIRPKKSR